MKKNKKRKISFKEALEMAREDPHIQERVKELSKEIQKNSLEKKKALKMSKYFMRVSEKTPTLVVGDESDLSERSEDIRLFSLIKGFSLEK